MTCSARFFLLFRTVMNGKGVNYLLINSESLKNVHNITNSPDEKYMIMVPQGARVDFVSLSFIILLFAGYFYNITKYQYDANAK